MYHFPTSDQGCMLVNVYCANVFICILRELRVEHQVPIRVRELAIASITGVDVQKEAQLWWDRIPSDDSPAVDHEEWWGTLSLREEWGKMALYGIYNILRFIIGCNSDFDRTGGGCWQTMETLVASLGDFLSEDTQESIDGGGDLDDFVRLHTAEVMRHACEFEIREKDEGTMSGIEYQSDLVCNALCRAIKSVSVDVLDEKPI